MFGIPILPVFVGYLIALSGIRQIAAGAEGFPDTRSVSLFRQAETCCGLLAGLSFLSGVLSLFFASGSGPIIELLNLGLSVLSGAVQLILGCLLLEGSASLLEALGNVELAVRYEGKTTAFLVFQTVAMLVLVIGSVWYAVPADAVGIFLSLAITIWLLVLWGEMKRQAAPFETEQTEAM